MDNTALHKFIGKTLVDNNYPIYEIMLIGIRNKKDMDKDVINDYLGYWTRREIFLCSGTTDPSVYWTLSFERNKGGTFHLVEGFHDKIWCIGKHRGYEALVNDYRFCKPTRGWRDVNYNFTQDAKDIITCDYYGINFHHMAENSIVNRIGKYSAGCQVVQKKQDHTLILNKVKSTGMYLNTPEKTAFSYLLLKSEDIPEIILK